MKQIGIGVAVRVTVDMFVVQRATRSGRGEQSQGHCGIALRSSWKGGGCIEYFIEWRGCYIERGRCWIERFRCWIERFRWCGCVWCAVDDRSGRLRRCFEGVKCLRIAKGDRRTECIEIEIHFRVARRGCGLVSINWQHCFRKHRFVQYRLLQRRFMQHRFVQHRFMQHRFMQHRLVQHGFMQHRLVQHGFWNNHGRGEW